ncbi:hypothetical protein P3339_13290 [Microbulbifer sp. MLAF003]|uniref:hypothetical protein n=1 Tax=Microbulbifer sp. MLAF003 TaxID=3032582 RepID=UPI0024ACED70|nr:hypothetical protein [Microbulbifer sp. MLAF003]WHI49446.1 hypothetical protein P3339_13290 [Microbulbifer sp. MLAF003]
MKLKLNKEFLFLAFIGSIILSESLLAEMRDDTVILTIGASFTDGRIPINDDFNSPLVESRLVPVNIYHYIKHLFGRKVYPAMS